MAEFKFISPGVFDREIDLTTRPADTLGAGPVVISPRSKGPAMTPVLLRDLDEDIVRFGLPTKDGRLYGAYAARSYLREATTPLTQIRLLGQQGTGITTGYSVGGTYAIVSSGSNVIALIHSSGAVTLQGTLTSSADSLSINIAGFGSVTASLNRNDSKYIKKVLNTDPSQYATEKHYVFAVYDYAPKTPTSNNAFAAVLMDSGASWTDDFITGSTTGVISQPFDATEYDLFGFGSIFAGDTANTEIKVSISDIKKSANPDRYEYGTFSVLVRKFDDTDRNTIILESFPNCNLDPDSPNYVIRRIGDRNTEWNSGTKKFDLLGDFENKSKYVYIVPSLDLKNGNVPATALPFGFNGYRRLTSGSFSDKASMPSLPYVQKMLFKSNFSTKVYWGAEVISNASGAINHGVPDKLKHLPAAALAASGTVDADFSLKYLSASTGNIVGFTDATRLTDVNIGILSSSLSYSAITGTPPTSGSGGYTGYLSLANIENTILAKFTLPINDGFDGVNIHKENPFDPSDMTDASQYQTHAYRTGLDMISNPDELDITELVLPGVWATSVQDYAIETVEDRGDLFYIADITGSTVDASVSDVVTKQLDTNYAACYYPYLRLMDDVHRKINLVPPTTIMLAVLAYSDKVSFPWFAPAGMTRGGLSRFGVVEAQEKLNRKDRDKLYENRINPIATFPSQGTVIWGQKTLQVQPSALDRINVRRMLLRTRKIIAKIARELVFEQNVASTWQKFENKVNPILERMKQDSGVDDFRVILNNTTTTEDLIERNIMYGQIIIKPTRTAEAIALDFILSDNFAAFAE